MASYTFGVLILCTILQMLDDVEEIGAELKKEQVLGHEHDEQVLEINSDTHEEPTDDEVRALSVSFPTFIVLFVIL